MATRPQEYPIGALTATPAFTRILCEQINQLGPLPFPDFMAAALYDPNHGYYARPCRQIGRHGDFFTSVSVGPLFGELLARRFLREWLESGSPPAWRIIESGAHDGTLAADILPTLASLDPCAFNSLEYVIPEPLPALQTAQRNTLRHYPQRVRFTTNLLEIADHPLPGIAFGNEVLDALPFHVVEWHGNQWLECRVALAPKGEFSWSTGAIHDPQLLAALAPLGRNFPVGYRTEVRTGLGSFLAPLAQCLQSGLMIWADYGFARPDYYHPDRTAGTLRTFANHRAGSDPLITPGDLDITAHVDFTALAEAALPLGARPTVFRNQGFWLTDVARPWLLEQDGHPPSSLMRQFQTLTHPAHLGASFHILELSWNPASTPPDATALNHRLFGHLP